MYFLQEYKNIGSYSRRSLPFSLFLPPPSLFAPATQAMADPGGRSGRVHSGGPGTPPLF